MNIKNNFLALIGLLFLSAGVFFLPELLVIFTGAYMGFFMKIIARTFCRIFGSFFAVSCILGFIGTSIGEAYNEIKNKFRF